MAKQPGSPDQIEAFANRLTQACIKACKEQGVVGEAKAQVWLEGNYSFTKEGELDLEVGVDIPAEVPADGKVGFGKDRTKSGTGVLKVSYNVSVKTRGGGA